MINYVWARNGKNVLFFPKLSEKSLLEGNTFKVSQDQKRMEFSTSCMFARIHMLRQTFNEFASLGTRQLPDSCT